jgi:thioredoxin
LTKEETNMNPKTVARPLAFLLCLLVAVPALRAMETASSDGDMANNRQLRAAVAHSDVPVLVDFWAPWCGPCHKMSATLSDLSREMQGRVKVVRVNIDDNPESGWSHRVEKLPTVLVFAHGRERARLEGNHSAGEIVDSVTPFIARAAGAR